MPARDFTQALADHLNVKPALALRECGEKLSELSTALIMRSITRVELYGLPAKKDCRFNSAASSSH